MFPCLRECVVKNRSPKMGGQNEWSKMSDKNDQWQMHLDRLYSFNEITTRYGPNRIILANENQRKLIQSECTCESITEFMAGHPSGLVQICQKVSRCVRKSICNASILNNVFWLDRSSWDYTVGHLPTVVRVTLDGHTSVKISLRFDDSQNKDGLELPDGGTDDQRSGL